MKQWNEDLQNRPDGEPISDALWQHLLTRKESSGGRVFYGVKTTKVFCQLGCPAKTPNRKNVLVFSLRENAIANGFRACKRCKP